MASTGQRIARAFYPAGGGGVMDPIDAMNTMSQIEYRKWQMSQPPHQGQGPNPTTDAMHNATRLKTEYELQQAKDNEPRTSRKLGYDVDQAQALSEKTQRENREGAALHPQKLLEAILKNSTDAQTLAGLPAKQMGEQRKLDNENAQAELVNPQKLLEAVLINRGKAQDISFAEQNNPLKIAEQQATTDRVTNAPGNRLTLAALQSGIPVDKFARYLQLQQTRGDSLGSESLMPVPTDTNPEGAPTRLQAAMENYLTLQGSDQPVGPGDITAVAKAVQERPGLVSKTNAEAVNEQNKKPQSAFEAALYDPTSPMHEKAKEQYMLMHHPDQRNEVRKDLDGIQTMLEQAGLTVPEQQAFQKDYLKAKLDALKKRAGSTTPRDRAPNQLEMLQEALRASDIPPEKWPGMLSSYAKKIAESPGGPEAKVAKTHGVYMNPKTKKPELAWVDETGNTVWTGVVPPPDVSKAPDLYDIKTEQRADGKYYLVYMPKEPGAKDSKGKPLTPVTTNIQAPSMMDPISLLVGNALGGNRPAPGPAAPAAPEGRKGTVTPAPSSGIPPMAKGIPPGSLYSPSRRQWKAPDGRLFNEDGTLVK